MDLTNAEFTYTAPDYTIYKKWTEFSEGDVIAPKEEIEFLINGQGYVTTYLVENKVLKSFPELEIAEIKEDQLFGKMFSIKK